MSLATSSEPGKPARGGLFAKDRRVREAARLWSYVTLGSIATLGALVIWHLVRRGRLIRERLGPPRNIRLEPLERPASKPDVPSPPAT
jgi:hypothetical protein